MRQIPKWEKITLTIFKWVISLFIAVMVIQHSIVPPIQWVYSDEFDFQASVYVRGDLTEWQSTEALLSGTAYRTNGEMQYIVNELSIGYDSWYFIEFVTPGEEITLFDESDNEWIIYVPKSEAISPYSRIIWSNILFIVLAGSITIFVITKHKQNKFSDIQEC